MSDLWKTTPHRRWNPLEREWILVSPHRTDRPWQGQVETIQRPPDVPYDPHCYLCPGNTRAQGQVNPRYQHTFVFDNDYAALKPDVPKLHENQQDLLIAETERGLCRVVCFSPEHHLTVARMDELSLRRVVDTWAGQYEDIESRAWIRYVQVFENRGEMMGASNPHPHCQIWSSESLPNKVARELDSQVEYRQAKHSCLLCDYLKIELDSKERLVCDNAHFAAVVPFWAIWPFEIMVLAKDHIGRMQQFSDAGRDALADILKQVTTRFDNLFEVSFPYSMGFHTPPANDGSAHDEWHFHAHFLPPLLRSATVRKFMVGYELIASPQRDITAEAAAERLRGVSPIHYLIRS
ncbi:MAG TPA: UDP-glucose--hexose-1-phosphate uridylyltransferase [Bryobacteraceae bacterium]